MWWQAADVVAELAPEMASHVGPWNPVPLARRVRIGSLGLLIFATLAGVLFPAALSAAGPSLLVAAALLGLPHGAVDHLALGWSRGRIQGARPEVVVLYAVAAVGVAAVALTWPLPALLALLVLSALHFGEGEAGYDRLCGGAGSAGSAAGVGGAVVALPLLLHPAQVRGLLTSLDPGLPGLLASVRTPLLIGVVGLAGAGLLSAIRHRQRLAALELVVVVAAFLLAPPLLVFSTWFAGWHASRHLIRMLALEPVGGAAQRAVRLARGAALPTAVALTGLGVLVALSDGLPRSVLVVLLALTVPHAAVVAWFGRRERGMATPGCGTIPR